MIPSNPLADKRLVRHRDTRWFGSGHGTPIPKPVIKRAIIPTKPSSKPDTTTREGETLEDVDSTGQSSAQPPAIHQIRSGRLPSPVRPNIIQQGNPGVWSSKNADPIRSKPVDPWQEYLPSLTIRQGSTAVLAFKQSRQPPDGRAFAIMKKSRREKESHFFRLSNIRNSSFLDILEVYDWSDCLFLVAEYISKSFLEIILNPIRPTEEQVACLADQVWPPPSIVSESDHFDPGYRRASIPENPEDCLRRHQAREYLSHRRRRGQDWYVTQPCVGIALTSRVQLTGAQIVGKRKEVIPT
jgi:hypothetical protein